ncbi:MAG TPA: ABC transporter substrate-binding protein [Castellaniella sp.]|jgi:NitT/TauT family transport system substrate-binding protein|nr:ABC transporter substrate-binding protein [Castellaniella sp.]
MMIKPLTSMLGAALLACVCSSSAFAAQTLKVAIGQHGNWDTGIVQLGTDAGIFKKHGLDLELLYTQGGGETMQAVISGSVDIGTGVGTIGVFAAYAKGAPVRIISSEATGSGEFWYVRSDSKLKSIKDAAEDTTIAYSTHGSSTNSIALGFAKAYGLKSKLVPTGNAVSTLTQVMSGQVDVGWASPPFGFKDLANGKIRIVGKAYDLDEIRHESVRVNISNASALKDKHDAIQKFMDAYRETLDWMYSGDDALKAYAKFAKVDLDTARRVRDEFHPKAMLDPDKVNGIDAMVREGTAFKTLSSPLTPQQIGTLIQIPPRQ